MEILSDTIINGKTINLENTDIAELNKYLAEVRNQKINQKNRLNSYLNEIYS